MHASFLYPEGNDIPVAADSVPFSSPNEAYARIFSPHATQQTLAYRREFWEELNRNKEVRHLLYQWANLLRSRLPLKRNHTEESKLYHAVTEFLLFCEDFEEFCQLLAHTVPQSRGAKRCTMVFRNYRESYEYRQWKGIAKDLIASLGWDCGFTLIPHHPQEDQPSRLIQETVFPAGIRATADRVLVLFGGTPESEVFPLRERTQTEIALISQRMRKDPKLTGRFRQFLQCLSQSDFKEIRRICREAWLYRTALGEETFSVEASHPISQPMPSPITVPWKGLAENRKEVALDLEQNSALRSACTGLCEELGKLSATAKRERQASLDLSYEEAFGILKENSISLMEHLKFLQRAERQTANLSPQSEGLRLLFRALSVYLKTPDLRALSEQAGSYPLLRPENAKAILHVKTDDRGCFTTCDLRFLGYKSDAFLEKHPYPEKLFSVPFPDQTQTDAWKTQSICRLANAFSRLTGQIRLAFSPLKEEVDRCRISHYFQ